MGRGWQLPPSSPFHTGLVKSIPLVAAIRTRSTLLTRMGAAAIAGGAILLGACGGGASSGSTQTQQAKSEGNPQVRGEEGGMNEESRVKSQKRAGSPLAFCL